MPNQHHNNQPQQRAAEYARRYDLTALLECVCLYDRPDGVRRALQECYFAIARQAVRTGDGAGDGLADTLATLETLIEALDRTTPTDATQSEAKGDTANNQTAAARQWQQALHNGVDIDNERALRSDEQPSGNKPESPERGSINELRAALEAARKTARDNADRAKQAEKRRRKAERACGNYADLYEDLYARIALSEAPDALDLLPGHEAFKKRLRLHGKK